MAPNVRETEPPSTRVGEYEAEDPTLIANKVQSIKKPKIVKVNTISAQFELPEQGSWHYNRKKAILAKYPEVAKLYGQNNWSFLLMLFGVCAQTFVGINMVGTSWPVFLFVCYTLGTYLAWVCIVMGHEGAHGLVFATKALNKIHIIIAFLPVFIAPFGSFWAIEHMYHHQIVVDKMERYGPQNNKPLKKLLFSLLYITVVGLLFFTTSFIAFGRMLTHHLQYRLGMKKTPYPESYNLRPFKAFPQVANSGWFVLNMIALIAFNSTVYYFYGFTPILYFFICNAFCNGLHPLGMRQVQEHYIQRRGQPTNSVYSSWNPFLLNIGYHNEHHDFPYVPGSRLHRVREIAPEFYDNLPHHESWVKVMWDYIFDKNITAFSRIKRQNLTDSEKTKMKSD